MAQEVRLSFSMGSALLVRLLPEQDLFEEIKSLAAEMPSRRMAIISGLGSLTDVVFRNLRNGIARPVSEQKTVPFEGAGPYELLSLQGNVVPADKEAVAHIHVTLGTPTGHVVGGHLFSAKVFTTAELVCLELPFDSLFRERSPETGLVEMICRGNA